MFLNNNSSNNVCMSCPANATCNGVSLACKAGYYKNANSCSVCPAGSYSNAGATSCSKCPTGSYSNTGASSCSKCPAGSYANASATGCSSCPEGYYSNAGASSCSVCPAGYYTSSGKCVPCPQGTFNPKPAQSNAVACIPCRPGSYSSSGAASCSVCPAGTYSNVNGASSCTPCPANATCENGSFSCNPRFYQNGNSCLACYVTCKTCIGSGIMQCTSCIEPFVFKAVYSLKYQN